MKTFKQFLNESRNVKATDEEITKIINKVAPHNRGWDWEGSNSSELTVYFDYPKKEDKAWSALEKALYPLGVSDVMVARK